MITFSESKRQKLDRNGDELTDDGEGETLDYKDDFQQREDPDSPVALDVKSQQREERRRTTTDRYSSPSKLLAKNDEPLSEPEESRNSSNEDDDEPIVEPNNGKNANSSDQDNDDTDQGDNYKSNNKYLRALAAEGIQVGRHVTRLKNSSKYGGNNHHHQQQLVTPTPQKNRKNLNPRRQSQSPPSPAVDTLLRVFPTKSRSEIDVVLSKTGGDVLKAIEVLLTSSETENLLFQHPHHQQSSAAVHQLNQQLHQLAPNVTTPMSVHQFIHQQQMQHQQRSSSRACFSPTNNTTTTNTSPTSAHGRGPIDLAMDSHHHRLLEHSFEKSSSNHHHNNNNHKSNNNNSLTNNNNVNSNNHLLGHHDGGSPPTSGRGGSESPTSAFSFFGPYAAAAAAAAARFHPNHPAIANRRFLPSLLPYGIPGLPRPGDFYPGLAGAHHPLVTAAAAAAMSSAGVLNLGTGGGCSGGNNTSPGTPGSQHENNNLGTNEREGTPPTSCSGSDRASYSE